MKVSNSHVFVACVAILALSACSGSSLSSTPNAQGAGDTSASRSTLTLTCAGSFTPVEPGQGGDTSPLTYKQLGGGDHLSVDAHGCDVGIYVPKNSTATLDHTDIHDANKYGIFVDDNSKLTVDHTTIEKIGDHSGTTWSPSGVQTGDGMWFSKSTGTVDHTDVMQYQKNGYAFRNNSSVGVEHSTATGNNTYGVNAQNGFEYISSNVADFQHNDSKNNHFTMGPEQEASATGYLFCSETGTILTVADFGANHDTASNNDVNFVASPTGTAVECN